jgi:hypothetical protein
LVTFDDIDGLLLWTWREAGLLAGRASEGHAVLHPAVPPRFTPWMAAQLTGTVLNLLGVVTPVHATAVRWQGRTLLLVGGSGSGKTTLALLLALCGGRVIAEDFVYLNKEGQLLGRSIRRHLTMRRGTWQSMRRKLEPWWGSIPVWASDAEPRLDRGVSGAHQVRLPIDPIEYRGDRAAIAIDGVLLPTLDPLATGIRLATISTAEVANICERAGDERMLRWPAPFLRPIELREVRHIPAVVAARVVLGLDYGRDLDGVLQSLTAQLCRWCV